MKLFPPCFFKHFMDIISNNNIAAVRRIFQKHRFYCATSGLFDCLRGRAHILGLAFLSLNNKTDLTFLIIPCTPHTSQAGQMGLSFPASPLQIP